MLSKIELKEMIRECIEEVLKPTVPAHTISEILNLMLLCNNCPQEIKHKKHIILRLLAVLGLDLNTDYSAFHNSVTITTLSTYIKNLKDIQGDTKRRYIRYVKELMTTANSIEPDHYKSHLINTLPIIQKTKKIERKPHLPFTPRQLKTIFANTNSFFNKHPDLYWICLIALYTGARQNAVLTLQYADIVKKDKIWCFHFIDNHTHKHLKTNATIRYVPIAEKLLQLGLLSYINTKKSITHASNTDFIFERSITKNNTYNAKYITRTLFKYFKSIKVKKKANDGHDFHSFRKNISLALQKAKVNEAYINDIIGWEGKTTMTQYYSNHTLKQIKKQLDKITYNI